MKTRIYMAALLSALFFFGSCGEDRTYEFEQKTRESHWIYNVMNQWYLWYYELPAMDNYSKFFSAPEAFFEKILSKKDKYSYFEKDRTQTRSIDLYSSYGFDFALYIDPVTQSQSAKERYARVLYVLPNSPASEVGLKRGDWIAAIGGNQITEKNYMELMGGAATTLTLKKLKYDVGQENVWWEESDTLSLSAARTVEDNPFYVDTVYHIRDRRIAYLFYNRFTTGPENTGNEKEYGNQMRQIFNRFKADEPTDFILDLRYNPGGYLSCAHELASLLAPESAMGKVFYTLEFNDKMSDRNEEKLFDPSLTGGGNLNLSRLYIIVSNETASASESIINGLAPVMGDNNIILVGTTTEGKNVASLTFQSDYGFSIHPIVATLYNGLGESDYASGFAPTYEMSELSYINDFKPLGDINEIMLGTTLRIILGEYDPSVDTRASLLANPLHQLKVTGTSIRPASSELGEEYRH